MDFQSAEAQFRQLDQQYRQGVISLEGYRVALSGLRVSDAQGRTWQLQEMSGQWHVYQDNRWVPATPPGRAQAPAPRTRAKPKSKRGGVPRLLLFGVGGLGLAGICLLGGLAAWYFFLRTPSAAPGSDTLTQAGGTASVQATEQTNPVKEMLVLEPGQTLTAAPGAVQTDPNGVSLLAPAGSLAEDQMAELSAFQIKGSLGEALGDSLSTPFYSASALGETDGVGRAELSFPAPSPDARILTVIDGGYLAVLDIVPEDGKLVINPRLAPQGDSVPADALDPEKGAQFGAAQTIHYAVITPPRETGSTAHNAIPSLETDPRDCTAPAYDGITINLCRKNPEGSVYLEYLFNLALTKEQADATVDAIAAAMKRYADLGFTAAKISPSNSVHVVVMQSGDPEYSFKTGVIYLPLDAAQSASQARRFEIYHEMAHWIQDEEYIMLFAGVSGAGRWWMETSAENMVMLLDQAAITRNMTTYGTIMGNEPLTALQSSPYQWPSDFYAHAQLVKVNMCASAACPISQQSFVAAINKGSYPFDDAGAQAKLNANLDDYARYLLGTAPQQANSAIPLTGPVQSGAGYGEEINVMKTTKTDFNVTFDGVPPQIQDTQARGLPAAAVQARIQKDGVYPLRVTSGRSGRFPGLPAALKIAPGAPFYYRVDGGGVQYSDGSEEVILQPIHQTLGLKDVRIVALGRTGSEVFSARLETISLEGTWLFKPESVVSNSVACSGETTEGDGDASAFGLALIGVGSAIGQYTPDESGAGLTWNLIPARLPPDTDTGDFTYNGSVLLTPDDIKLQAGIDIPRQESSQAPGWGLAMAGGLLPVGLVLARRRRFPPYAAIIVLLVCTLTLSACFDLKIYGDTTSEMSFTKLEYMGGEETAVYGIEAYPATMPLWQLSGGQATYAVDFKIEVTTEDEEGNEVTEIETCAGTAVYKISAGVFKDVIVQTEGE